MNLALFLCVLASAGAGVYFGFKENVPAVRDCLKVLLISGVLWCVFGSLTTCQSPFARTQAQRLD